MSSIYNFPYMNSNSKIGLLLQAFFPVSSNSWWFITSYVILFLMIPILNKLIEGFDSRHFLLLIIILCIWYATTVFDLLYQGLQRSIFFYSLGALLKRTNFKFRKWSSLLLFIFSWCVFIFCDMIIYGIIGQGSSGKLFTKFFEMVEIICVPLAVISLFCFFYRINVKTNRFINTIASTTFGIYLFHDSNIGRQFIWDGLLHVIDKQYVSLYFPIYAIVSVSIVFTCGAIIDLLRQKLFDRKLLPLFENKINKFLGIKNENCNSESTTC